MVMLFKVSFVILPDNYANIYDIEIELRLSMNELYIIGNGFDLYHGLSTSYNDFKNYLLETKSPVYEKVDKFLYYNNKDDKSTVWNEFEQNLSNLNEDALIEECRCFLISYGDPNWKDSGHHDFQYCIEEVTTYLTSELLDSFTSWIKISNKQINNTIPKMNINKNAKFLTFNYTMTLEMVYEIFPTNILHIHNSVEEKNLILGHNYSNEEREIAESKLPVIRRLSDIDEILAERGLEEDDVRYREGKDIIKSYYGANYKNSDIIIKKNLDFFRELNNCERIYVLGHSLTNVDMKYLMEILNYVSNGVKWYITWYSEIDKENIQKFISNSKIRNYQMVKITDKIFKYNQDSLH